LNLDKFRDVKEEQSLNIEFIFVKDDVLKLDKSNDNKEVQP
jgi:hypothetical protein